jgi:hypothetical protein
MRKALMILSVTAMLAVVIAPPASAQFSVRPIDKSTLLTFSGPVSLPNVTLPAGTYLFKFADPNYAPDVLSVMSKDEKTTYAVLNTIPIVRIEPKSGENQQLTFKERPASEPPAIDAWFFDATESIPGSEDVGCELIYSK